MNSAKNLVQKLQLRSHPEGGYFAETYRSSEIMLTHEGKSRNISTAIYFLLEDENKSHFHRIQSDELWFFHQGEPLEIVTLQNGTASSIILGNNIENGEIPQAIIPANIWFAARVKNGMGYSLVSCTVAPGFDFLDFELAKREDLLQQFPHLKNEIEMFTRQ
ncbi:MAG TPA: cupin domain-containing protein [Agriterribacter sp.]|nr:cupin domain-containing protein [Agriterribacter sp.]